MPSTTYNCTYNTLDQKVMIHREASTCVFLSDTSSRFADPLPPENPNDFFLVPLGRSRLSVTPSKLHNSIISIQAEKLLRPILM